MVSILLIVNEIASPEWLCSIDCRIERISAFEVFEAMEGNFGDPQQSNYVYYQYLRRKAILQDGLGG
jgi:hypothetical protein